MNILGISFGLHDASASLVVNGKLVSAISLERINRYKKAGGTDYRPLFYTLKAANLKLEDIDYIAITDYYQESKLPDFEITTEDDEIITGTWKRLFGNDIEKVEIKFQGHSFEGFIVSHHMSHAASTYYTSNLDNSWVMTLDSCFGKAKENGLIAKGEGNKLNFVKHHGLVVGVMYAVFTTNILHELGHLSAGKTMGLASYGKPNKDLLTNMEYYLSKVLWNPEAEQEDYFENFYVWFNSWSKSTAHENMSFKMKANLAADVQHLFEESILRVVKGVDPNAENICLAGGSFLNCNVNTRIKQETNFKNIHHFPACGDDGLSTGAALYLAHHVFDEPRTNYFTSEIVYTGTPKTSIEPNYDFLAKKIAEGKIVAWFMGGSEFGPRALGHRSILGDPRSYHTREILNFAIKKREWFRPYAPVVLEEYAKDWFDFDGPSPLMLYTAKVLQPEKIPAATHVDGTSRMQTINKEMNLEYYKMVEAFYKLTGIPILINTSLNGPGEPIVETEEEALLLFNNSDLDILVLNGRILEK